VLLMKPGEQKSKSGFRSEANSLVVRVLLALQWERLHAYWVVFRHLTDWFWKLPVGIGLLCLLSLAVLEGTEVRSYLDEYGFFAPTMVLRKTSGAQPKLNDQVRVIVVDDRSLNGLGRFPSFSEWYQISGLLAEIGVEKTFLVGLIKLKSEVGTLLEKNPKVNLTGGVLSYPGAFKNVTVPAGKFSGSILTESKDPKRLNIDQASFIRPQHPEAMDFFSKVGHLNVSTSYKVAYSTQPEYVLPFLPFLVLDNLRWQADGFYYGDQKKIPMSYDGTHLIDWIDYYDLVKNKTLPVRSFYQDDNKTVARRLRINVKDRLKGAKYVVFVKEAYQGSRFVETPNGQVPAYLTSVSAINSILNGFFLYRPVEEWKLLLGFVPLFVVFFGVFSASIALYLGPFLIMGLYLLSVSAMIKLGWVMPAASVAFIGFVAWAGRATHFTIKVIKEKGLLNRDLQLGQTVQQTFIPDQLEGQAQGWEFKFCFQPFGVMSGDWVNVYQSPPECPKTFAIFAIGDVVGKGPSAALNTAVIAGIWNLFRSKWDRGEFDMTELIGQLNRIVADTFRSHQNTTISIAYACGDELLLVSCGAPTWVRMLPGSKAKSVRSIPYDPVGLQLPEVQVKSISLEAQAGEIFIAHTDGVMEGSKNRKLFLKEMSDISPGQSTQTVFNKIEDSAREIGADEVLPDDFTMLMIRRLD
jgi:hypothetical protein